MKAEYYKLSDEDKEAIEYHNKTFKEIDKIGFDILDDTLSSKDKLDDYLIPIRSILYRLLEFNDTLKIMISNALINTSFPILRSEFEIIIQLLFILQDKTSTEKKSLLYYYCDLRRINNNIDTGNLNNFLSEKEIFSEIHAQYSNKSNIDKTSWYSLFNDKRTSFLALCKLVNEENYYNILYPHLSADIHGTSCIELNTVCFKNGGKYYLRNFRTFERHHTIMIYHIDLMRKIFNSFQDTFQIDGKLKDDINSFNNRSKSYISTYLGLKDTSLDPMYMYSI